MATFQILFPRLTRSTWLAAAILLAGPGCERSTSRSATQPVTASDPSESAAPGDSGPRIQRACLTAYAECPAFDGLPALSADATLVAVPDMERAGEREERVLTVHVIEVESGKPVSELPVLTYADYDEGADPMTAELDAATRAAIEERAIAVEHELARGKYRPLTALGRVHEQLAGQEVDGLRASFDGKELVVTDTRTGQARWRRALGAGQAEQRPSDDDAGCEVLPVADVTVWASREPGVAVAHVTYVGSDDCDAEASFQVWR